MLELTYSRSIKSSMFVNLLIISAFTCFFSGSASAHSEESLPSFKVNGNYVEEYSVPLTSSKFNIPEDAAKNDLLVNEAISFEIDAERIAAPEEIVQKTTFSWDFGDGQMSKGLKNSHSYNKPGSYVLLIDAQYDEVVGKQLLQSVLINILPDEKYSIPKSVISVNGKKSADPIVDIINLDFGKELVFDAGDSTATSSKIVKYIWDFGDGSSASGVKVKHTYSRDLIQDQVFPVLRVKDENGFISDSYVQISRSEEGGGRIFSEKLIFALAAIFAVITAVFVILMWKK